MKPEEQATLAAKLEFDAMEKAMEIPYCEICGEAHAEIRLENLAACLDCACAEFRPGIRAVLGYDACCFPIRHQDFYSVCLHPRGVEHDHSDAP